MEKKCLGTLLQNKRKELDMSVEDVSKKLKIRKVYLKAIEHDNFTELPQGSYMFLYIKCYCNFLGIDSKKFINSINNISNKSSILNISKSEQYHHYSPSIAVLLIAVVMIILIYKFLVI